MKETLSALASAGIFRLKTPLAPVVVPVVVPFDHDGDAGHRLPGHGFHASGDVALRRCGLRMDTCRKKERQRQASQYPADMLGKVSLHRLAGLMFVRLRFCTGGSDP